jgi:hypothetical protein
MPEMAAVDYEPVLSSKAWELLCALSRKRQQRLTRLIQQIAACPSQVGDYQSQDSTGRKLENLRLEGFLITYWADGAVNELRVLDIVEL